MVDNLGCFVLRVLSETNLDHAWQVLQKAGLQPLYIEEFPGNLPKIHLLANSEEDLQNFAFLDHVERQELKAIDWHAQWEIHGFNFHEGYVHIDLPEAVKPAWRQLKLIPGAGFGDLSHPTTRLMLKMMKNSALNHDVIDIGCGSGVLALCAGALGAKHIYAVDIAQEALMHSRENAQLNQMENIMTFVHPDDFNISSNIKAVFILMNMTMAEQQQAWNGFKSLHQREGICLTSGILIEQKQGYLKWIAECEWGIQEEQEEQGWLAFKLIK